MSTEVRRGSIIYLTSKETAGIYFGFGTVLDPKTGEKVLSTEPMTTHLEADAIVENLNGSITATYTYRGKVHQDTFPEGAYIVSKWEETAEAAESRKKRNEQRKN